MAFKMKGFGGFKNSPMKKEDMGAVSKLTEEEKKPKTGTAPGSPKSVYNLAKKAGKAHSKLHRESEGVREATKKSNPWAMGSMK